MSGDFATLLLRARNGDQEAFCCLVDQEQARLRGYIARYVSDSEDILDMAQETFIEAYHKLADFDLERDWGAWLRGIARHRCLDHLRSRSRRRRREQRAMADFLESKRLQELEAEDDCQLDSLQALGACVDRLRQQGGRAFTLIEQHYLQNRDIDAVAAAHGMSISAARMALSRARKILRECMHRKPKETTT